MTGSLAEVLERFRIRDLFLPRKELLAEPMSVAAQRKVLQHFAPGAPKPPLDLAEIVRRVESAWRSGKMQVLDGRDLRYCAQALFAGRALARERGFLQDYLAEVLRRANGGLVGGRSALPQLLAIYLINFDPESDACQRLAKGLEAVLRHFSSRWQERMKAGRLLDVRNGPLHAGRALVKAAGEIGERNRIGLHGVYSGSNFAQAAISAAGRELVAQFVRAARKPDGWDKFVAILAPQGQIEGAHREAALAIFLDPFGKGAEPEGLRAQVKPLLLASFGDPRVNAARWPYLAGPDGPSRREAYLGVVRRWLISETIDLFFTIIDEHGLDRHWSKRKAFWRRYFKSGLVTDAWVAFASRPNATAQRIKARNKETAALEWGRLRGTVQGDHAVLLMQIGPVTVAEWSHNGKVRIWQKSHANAPLLYLAEYEGDALRASADFETVHKPPDGWQDKVERELRRQIGVGPDGRR